MDRRTLGAQIRIRTSTPTKNRETGLELQPEEVHFSNVCRQLSHHTYTHARVLRDTHPGARRGMGTSTLSYG